MALTFVSTVSGSTAISTTDQSSVTDNGVTFNFDRAMPVGQFEDGAYFVVSDQAFDITSITPASSGGANGAMKDPYISVGGDQGFDINLASGNTSSDISYSSALNIDPGNSGSDISISLGEETSIVKTERVSGATAGDWHTIEKYVTLTVLSTSPPVGTLRPTSSGTNKRLYNWNNVDWTVFRSISMTIDSPATIEGQIPLDNAIYGTSGEQIRRLRMDAGVGGSSNHYAAAIAPRHSNANRVMHASNYTQGQKEDLLKRLLVWGIQTEGVYDRGWRGTGSFGGGAGQSFAWFPACMTTAFALGSASMLTKFLNMSCPMDNCYWLTSANIDLPPGSKSGNQGIPFFDEHLDTAFCQPDGDTGSNFETRYGAIAASGNFHEAAAIVLLQNGPSGETGFSARNAGAYGTSNVNSAIWGMCDRTARVDPWPASGYDPGGTLRSFWINDIQGLGLWTAEDVNETIHTGSDGDFKGENGDIFTAGSGSYSWNLSAYDYSSTAITDTAFRYSLDGTQWVTVTGKSANDSQTGLLPSVVHHTSIRRQTSSFGWAAWSHTYQTIPAGSGGVLPNIFATTGSGTAAIPTFTTNPTVHAKIKDNWGDNSGNWEPAPSVLGVDQVELKCGQGYVDGNATPSFAYQWQRSANGTTGWADISGETNQTYSRTATDAEQFLRCQITPSNSAGTGSEFSTAAVECPAVTTLPAGTLIDTNFRGAFAVDYASEIASIVEGGYDVFHQPGAAAVQLGENVGALYYQKVSSFPDATFDLSTAAEASSTYDITFQIAIDGDTASNGNFTFKITESGGSDLLTQSVSASVVDAEDNDDYLWGFTGTFTTGSVLNLQVTLENPVSTGGGGGGKMYLHQLSIVKQ